MSSLVQLARRYERKRDACRRLQMQITQARREAEKLRLELATQLVAVTFRLAPQQARVLEYLRTDLSNKEIANEMGISVSTVKFHTRELFERYNAHTRHQLITRAAIAKTEAQATSPAPRPPGA